MTSAAVREAVGVFDDASTFEHAIEELLNSGFSRGDISLLAGHDAVESKLGHMYTKIEDLEDDPRAPRLAYKPQPETGDAEGPFVGALTYLPPVLAAGVVVASTGALAAAISLGAIAGGLLVTVFSRWTDERRADEMQTQLDHGGLLLWVRAETADKERSATTILARHSAHDVHIHDIPI